MDWKLFLTVERDPQVSDEWTIVRSSNQALRYLREYGMPKEMRLDFALGEQNGARDTAMNLLVEMSEGLSNGTLSFPKGFTYMVRSSDQAARDKMDNYLKNLLRHFP